MKHAVAEADVRRVVSSAAELGLEISESAVRTLLEYLELVLAANATLNLTRITDPEEAIRLHLLDSIAAQPEVDAAPPGALIDLGTGAGFPGVPLAVVTGRRSVLVDSTGKKVRAVGQLLGEVDLQRQIEVRASRVEEIAVQGAGRFAVASARALSSLPSLVELASPLLVDGGRLVALKGVPDEREVEAGRRVGEMVGMSEISSRRIELPGGQERRTVVSYAKTGESSVELPRRVGAAQRAPLA